MIYDSVAARHTRPCHSCLRRRLLARGRIEVDASSVACLPRSPLDAPPVPTITCHDEFLDDTLGREFRKFCRGVVGGRAGEPPDLARRQPVRKGRKDGENEL